MRIADGKPLSFEQRDLIARGHAIECRINAEEPTRTSRRPRGRCRKSHLPGGFGVRVDSHVYAGLAISPYYDSLLAKIVVHGATREEAIVRMDCALARNAHRRRFTTTIPACAARSWPIRAFRAGGVPVDYLSALVAQTAAVWHGMPILAASRASSPCRRSSASRWATKSRVPPSRRRSPRGASADARAFVKDLVYGTLEHADQIGRTASAAPRRVDDRTVADGRPFTLADGRLRDAPSARDAASRSSSTRRSNSRRNFRPRSRAVSSTACWRRPAGVTRLVREPA